MGVHETADIRNVVVAGHGGAGKTTLVSALLYASGAVNRLGRVEDGNTVTDSEEDEIERGVSLSAALAHCEWNETRLNLLDTPGYSNFINEARLAAPVADTMLVAVCASDGISVNTERVWSFAEDNRLGAVLALTRMDRERASFADRVKQIQETFGRSAIPVQLPIGEREDFSGVVDLIRAKAILGPGPDGAAPTVSDIPGELAAAAEEARAELMEMIAESDEELLDLFFESGELSEEQMTRGLAKAVATRQVFPIVAASGARNIGTSALLDAFVSFCPDPSGRGALRGKDEAGEPAERKVTSDGPTSLYVFKTIADPFAGRLNLFRVMSGRLRADASLTNLTNGETERFGGLNIMSGKTMTPVAELAAGDLGCVAKLKSTATGDTLAADRAVRFPRPDIPRPVISFAIIPKSRGDEDKISGALQRLAEEDLTLKYGRETELLLSGTGQLHIEVIVSRMKRRFGVEVELRVPRVPYRETITKSVEAHGRHKKQSGGHGQFADCHVRVEPLDRGADFQFASEIVGGAIPRQYIPAIEKGFQEARQKGVLAGHPVVDFKATVFDGKFHAVDSSEIAFKIAASLAFKDAMAKCGPVLLEPIMSVEIQTPEDATGDVLGDLNSRRGRTQGMDQKGGQTHITAQAPMAEMLTYEPTLTSLTGGRGAFHMDFSHYEPVPGNLTRQIIEAERGKD